MKKEDLEEMQLYLKNLGEKGLLKEPAESDSSD